MTKTTYNFFNFFKNNLILISLMLLFSCVPTLPPADPGRAEQLRTEGLKFNLKHDYAAAIDLYSKSTLYDPLNSGAYLILAELLEATEKPKEAFNAYERALRYLPTDNPDREFITYRSALLLAEKLKKPGKAQRLLEKLSTPALKSDLAGVIAMQQEDPSPSFELFQDALRYDLQRDQYARVYFHIAQAYDRLGDEDQSRDALLISVEKATSRALKEDIRRFFEAMLTRK